MAEKLDSGSRSIGRMTTGKDDKAFLSFPLVGNHSLEIYNPPITEWLRTIDFNIDRK
ncbi:MAG: hypothetical protein L0956_04475 [Candidatus Mariimomonas ferrooxydans]